ncbi:uncharacterized protein HD556DRAFT_1442625 [Suillus plorans]|uniref:Uncharacterized protein n=1 Tax=Suillus plorans TaxID=116603 RepID=A0A9P7ATK4_9AGAM|nr:uncharacterized protein HD556DRAFT_1442625 [Suillus plorans]KAG1794839.1 hypothetical protein HD556DRAFT_1442625 [Suillus plorans]
MSQGWLECDGDLLILVETDLNRSMDSGFVDITMGSPASIPTLGTRRNWMSTHDQINSALQTLRDGCISILDFLITILDPADASVGLSNLHHGHSVPIVYLIPIYSRLFPHLVLSSVDFIHR